MHTEAERRGVTEKQRQRDTDRLTTWQIGRQSETQRDMHTCRQSYREAERQRSRQRHRNPGRDTDPDRNIQSQTETQRSRHGSELTETAWRRDRPCRDCGGCCWKRWRIPQQLTCKCTFSRAPSTGSSCRSSSAWRGWLCRSSCWACSSSVPISWRRLPGQSCGTLLLPPPNECSLRCCCPSGAPAGTATAAPGRYLRKSVNQSVSFVCWLLVNTCF